MLKAVAAFFLWALLAGYLGGVYWLSAQQDITLPGPDSIDKLLHAVAYFGLCVVARGAFGTLFARRSVAVLVATAVTLIYAATDEWHQSVVPTRTPDLYDWIADATGGVVAAVLFLALDRRRRGRQSVATKPARA